MSQYSELVGSFARTSNFPLEANYIFSTEADLINFYNDPVQKATLHEGLFKIVENDDSGQQALYWVTKNEDGELEFTSLISGGYVKDLLPQLQQITDNLVQEIENRKAVDQAIWGTQDYTIIPNDSNSILNLSNYVKKLEEQIQGNTQVLLTALVKEAYYDTTKECLTIVFSLSNGSQQKLEIPLTNLIREWEPDNNHPSKVVEVYRQITYGGGADKLSADVRISTHLDNILEKDGNSLLVRGVSENITHDGVALNTVIKVIFEKLKELEDSGGTSVPLSITTFKMNIPEENEEGTSVNPIFTWTYNVSKVDQQLLNDEQIDTQLRTKQINNITSNTTVTLYASYKGYTDTKELKIVFVPRIYFGASESEQILDYAQLSDSKLWSDGVSLSYDCTGGKYAYCSVPSTYADKITFWVSNLEVTSYTTSVIQVTNSEGKEIEYTLFKLDNKLYDQFNMEIKLK